MDLTTTVRCAQTFKDKTAHSVSGFTGFDCGTSTDDCTVEMALQLYHMMVAISCGDSQHAPKGQFLVTKSRRMHQTASKKS